MNADHATHEATRARHLQSLPHRTYGFRVLGMGLAALPILLVLRELHAGWAGWAWMVASCLVWPHFAYWHARRSRDPFIAELRNLMVDSLIAGSWVPLMQFNVLPSVMLLAVTTADKVNSGVRGLWLRSLPGMFAAVVVGGIVTGFQTAFVTSMPVLLACLPIMVIHTLAVSSSSYRLVRRVQRQNLRLEQLSRIDALTGLDGRRHWETRVRALLDERRAGALPATLLLVDVDRFKEINDHYGHAVGDDVLRAIADLIQATVADEGHAGRLGGDEFVVALPRELRGAQQLAERLRLAVQGLSFEQHPALRCSISVGIAALPAAPQQLREWLDAADRALYRAKDAGRNRIANAGAEGAERA